MHRDNARQLANLLYPYTKDLIVKPIISLISILHVKSNRFYGVYESFKNEHVSVTNVVFIVNFALKINIFWTYTIEAVIDISKIEAHVLNRICQGEGGCVGQFLVFLEQPVAVLRGQKAISGDKRN